MNNPYQTPEVIAADDTNADTSLPITFQGVVDSREIKSLFGGWWLPAIVVGMVSYLAFENGIMLQAFFLQSDTLGMIAVIVVCLAVINWIAMQSWFRIGPGFLNYFRNGFPDLFLPTSGFLDEHWLVIRNANRETRILRSAFTRQLSNGGVLWLLLDSLGAQGYFFARSMFASYDYERFINFIRKDIQTNNRGFVTLWTNSGLTDPDQVLALPNEPQHKIEFAGVLNKADILIPPVREVINRSVFWLLLRIAFTLLALLAVAYLLMQIAPLMSLFCLPMLLLAVRRYAVKFSPIGVGVSKKRAVMAVGGIVTDKGISISTPLASSDYKWTAFEDVWSADQRLALKMNGNHSGWLVLPRHFFADDQAWQAAKTMISYGVPNKSANLIAQQELKE